MKLMKSITIIETFTKMYNTFFDSLKLFSQHPAEKIMGLLQCLHISVHYCVEYNQRIF